VNFLFEIKSRGCKEQKQVEPGLMWRHARHYWGSSVLCNLHGMHVQFISEDYVPGSPIVLPESSLTDLLCFKRSETHWLFLQFPVVQADI
jgi:hypothetical protein